MKKIMIDLDDTITYGGYLDIVNNYLQTNYTYKDLNYNYWVDDIVPQDKLPNYLKYLYNEINFYDYIKISENALETIKELSKYYEIIICSSYIDSRDYENCINLVSLKYKWLRQNLPFIKPENFVFTNNKSVIKTDIKIDDRVSNLTENTELSLVDKCLTT